MGDGIGTGSWTTDTGATFLSSSTIELGLRAKLRFNSSGDPENTYNSNGLGTYSFDAGTAPTQAPGVAVWSFEWSVNTDSSDPASAGLNLNDLTYSLSMTSSTGASITSFDMINGSNAGLGRVQWDHAVGNNLTGPGGGSKILNSVNDPTGYNTLITNNNVAQNSWQPHWFGFDGSVDGTYDFVLTSYYGGSEVASTSMQVIVGTGAVVPTPSAALGSMAMLGILGFRRRRRA